MYKKYKKFTNILIKYNVKKMRKLKIGFKRSKKSVNKKILDLKKQLVFYSVLFIGRIFWVKIKMPQNCL